MKTINEIVLWNCLELGDEIVSKVGDEIVMQILDKSDLAGGCFVCKLGRLMWPTCLPKNSGLIRLNGQIYPGPWWGLPPESGYLSKWWNSRFRRCWHHNGPLAGSIHIRKVSWRNDKDGDFLYCFWPYYYYWDHTVAIWTLSVADYVWFMFDLRGFEIINKVRRAVKDYSKAESTSTVGTPFWRDGNFTHQKC